ncbi:MAG: hypothetical protein ACRDHZ_09500, partial [Ktedonobacteraceae bacterium]
MQIVVLTAEGIIVLAIILSIIRVMSIGGVRPRQMLYFTLQMLRLNTSFGLGCGALLFEITIR